LSLNEIAWAEAEARIVAGDPVILRLTGEDGEEPTQRLLVTDAETGETIVDLLLCPGVEISYSVDPNDRAAGGAGVSDGEA
jgi:hypothetical protein